MPERTWAIHPSPSRLLALWHVAVHALAVLSVSVSGLGWPLKLAIGAALILHAGLRRPRPPLTLCCHEDGGWSLPTLGQERLRLCRGTAVGPFWARLVLATSASKVPVAVLVLMDQVGREDWRRLQAILRRRTETGTV